MKKLRIPVLILGVAILVVFGGGRVSFTAGEKKDGKDKLKKERIDLVKKLKFFNNPDVGRYHPGTGEEVAGGGFFAAWGKRLDTVMFDGAYVYNIEKDEWCKGMLKSDDANVKWVFHFDAPGFVGPSLLWIDVKGGMPDTVMFIIKPGS